MLNKARQDRPEVAVIFLRKLAARNTEGLTGKPTGPDRSVVGNSSKAAGEAEAADTGEEMALSVSGEVRRCNIDN